jgi:hypothetical protein
MAGLDSQPGEIPSGSKTDLEVFRLGVGFKDIVGPLTGSQTSKSITMSKRVTKEGSFVSNNDGKSVSEVNWDIECSQTAIPTGQLIFNEI